MIKEKALIALIVGWAVLLWLGITALIVAFATKDTFTACFGSVILTVAGMHAIAAAVR